MKVDRVILSSNFNPLYYNFWNPLSKVYKEKFGIEPTLMWLGTKEEMIEANISDEYGDVVIVEANDKHPIAWQTTWALFWGTKFYKDDTCWVMGIDQVPLSKMFINLVKDLKDTDYAMLISDAYLPHHWTKTASPSSYHIAKGSTFTEVYSFEESFIKETDKLVNSGVDAFWEDTEGRWGIDESYSCYKLREAKDTNIVGFNTFNVLVERRIECERHKETPYSIEKLNAGWYSESHLCRPFTNHTEYLTTLFNSIPDFR
jgi:hypothetical protein